MPMSQLRQEGLLNIIYIPLDIKKPSSEDRVRALRFPLSVWPLSVFPLSLVHSSFAALVRCVELTGALLRTGASCRAWANAIPL